MALYRSQFRPSCMAIRSSLQSIPHATVTAVVFNGVEEYDTLSLHDPATNPSRITVPAGYAGDWMFGYGSVRWAASAVGTRGAWMSVNGGSARYAEESPATNGFVVQEGSTSLRLSAGDYVEVMVFQSSGAALDVDGSSLPLRFWANFLGR